MSKFYCPNKECNQFNQLKDVDISIVAYHVNGNFDSFDIKKKKIICKECNTEMDLLDTTKEKVLVSSKFSRMTPEEKKSCLQARSRDLRIGANRESSQRMKELLK